MKRIIVIFLFLLLLSNGCLKQQIVGFNIVEKADICLDIHSPVFREPIEMLKNKNYFFIADFRGDSLLWIYDVSKQSLLRKDAPRGIEINEFQPPIEIACVDSILMIHNRWHHSARTFLVNGIDCAFVNNGRLDSLPIRIDRLYPITNKLYIASGRFEEGRYALLDEQGDIIQFFGDFPSYQMGEQHMSNLPKFLFHQTTFTYNQQQRLLASITGHVLDIMDCSQNPPVKTNRVLLSKYRYSYFESNGYTSVRMKKNTELGAIFSCSTDKYIYIVYDPTTKKTFSSDKIVNSEVWVFDWSGKPIRKIVLDYQITCLSVDNEDAIAYCILKAPKPVLAYFNL